MADKTKKEPEDTKAAEQPETPELSDEQLEDASGGYKVTLNKTSYSFEDPLIARPTSLVGMEVAEEDEMPDPRLSKLLPGTGFEDPVL